jgi:hypothetical protein
VTVAAEKPAVAGAAPSRGESAADRAFRVTDRIVSALSLSSRIHVNRRIGYELTSPPAILRGFRDLVVRPGGVEDAASMHAIDGTSVSLVHERLARGDEVFLGALEGRVLCQSWFHRGPTPFTEHRPTYPSWRLAHDTYWSYGASTAPEVRTSGVFVKVFQHALNVLFTDRGAGRIQCFVRHTNQNALLLHERLGFRRLGTITVIAAARMKWLWWVGPRGARHWIVPRHRELVLPMPPVADGPLAGRT